ncbi:hypothetical protein THRCLA_11658 [Thraustotheca clavata]|uniref:C2 domain-containing protein n=1 Tax=Thraustotheca clavata TaxID=74557 RepID=A0A1V9Y738_9STRA|nr:hypothetical protein THRCLA_11658 [Thraustotheca clavata]
MDANVGARVEVFWESEDGWFTGIIQEYDAQVGYRVLYDDGDEQWETASNPDRFHILQNIQNDERHVEAMDPPDDAEQEQDDVVQAIDPPSDEESESSNDVVAPTEEQAETKMNAAISIPLRVAKKQIQQEMLQAGPGTALLSGNVQYVRSELDTVYNAYVKVSFVAPGPGSVMLRCKTVLFTTTTIANSARPIWRDAIWSYSIPNDDGKPWESLRGDLLFAVFNQGENNIFIGQVVLPIQSFLSDNCPPGPQTLFDEEYSLTSRQGNLLGGIYLRLSHQLILPPAKLSLSSPMPDMSRDDVQLFKPKKSKQEPINKGKKKHISSHYINRTKREIEIQHENEGHKKRVQGAKSRQPKTPNTSNKLTAHSAINRKKELAVIDAENKRLQCRRKNINKDKRTATQPSDPPIDMASQATYVIQVELTTSVALLQKNVAELEQELVSNKSSLSRLTISNGKDSRVLENLEKAYKRTQSAATKANVNTKPSKPTKKTNDNTTALDKSEHLALLERENASIVAERQELMNQIRSLHSEESEAQEIISKLEMEFARVESRRAYLYNPKASSDNAQVQIIKAWNELTNLKICVAALEEKADQTTIKQQSNEATNENWHEKLQNRKEKEFQIKAQRDVYRQEYEQLITSKAVENLRQQVLEMQHMLLLCEHEEKAMIAANIDAQVKVQDAAIAFQRQFHAEKTDTDVLFQVTNLQ